MAGGGVDKGRGELLGETGGGRAGRKGGGGELWRKSGGGGRLCKEGVVGESLSEGEEELLCNCLCRHGVGLARLGGCRVEETLGQRGIEGRGGRSGCAGGLGTCRCSCVNPKLDDLCPGEEQEDRKHQFLLQARQECGIITHN